jgi:hypothetical protein
VIRDVLNEDHVFDPAESDRQQAVEEKIAAAVVKAGWRQAQEKAVLLQ